MMLVMVGGLLAALGLVAAGLLVAAPLGWVPMSPGLTLWVLFPLFTLVGYTLLVIGSRDPAVKAPTLLLAAPLLLMAGLAAVGLLVSGAGLVDMRAGTGALWYVLLLGGLLGGVGTAVSGRRADA